MHVRRAAPALRDVLGLDLIRFAAAGAVMLYHLGQFWWFRLGGADAELFRRGLEEVSFVARYGSVGVEVFFVISGFVIAYSANGRTPKSFLESRLLRLYPAAWICATLTFVLALGASRTVISKYLLSMLLWPTGPWVSGVYWTLGVEIAFYSYMAMALWLRVGVTRASYLLIAWSAGFYFLRLVNVVTGRSLQPMFNGLSTPLGNLTLLELGCLFGVGMMICSIKREGISFGRISALAAAFSCSVAATAANGKFVGVSYGYGSAFAIIFTLIWVGSCLGIVASVWRSREIDVRLGRFSKMIRALGLMTYPLYLVHSELGRGTMLLLKPFGPMAALLIAMMAMMLLSWLIVRAEEPVRSALRKVMHLPQTISAPRAELP